MRQEILAIFTGVLFYENKARHRDCTQYCNVLVTHWALYGLNQAEMCYYKIIPFIFYCRSVLFYRDFEQIFFIPCKIPYHEKNYSSYQKFMLPLDKLYCVLIFLRTFNASDIYANIHITFYLKKYNRYNNSLCIKIKIIVNNKETIIKHESIISYNK